MSKRVRQYFGLVSAVAAYYLVHEGAHWITAVFLGVFRQINFLGFGIQIDVFAEQMTTSELGIFCLMGSAATMLTGWGLVMAARRICEYRSKVLKAVMWYVSLTMLLLDPVYLSVLCGFFGGGDMNGIKLLLPELYVRIFFGIVGILHGIVAVKYLLPLYTRAFHDE